MFIRNESALDEYRRGDVQRSIKKAEQIVGRLLTEERLIQLAKGELAFAYLDASERYRRLEEQLTLFINAEKDTIEGIFLLGHGNSNLFLTYKNKLFEGEALGRWLFDLVSKYRLAAKLPVYLGSCHSDCKTLFARKL
ncbi:MAG: hypothetical protein JWQ35_994 [Bacteriovoracaceae bacterium]|nr:hypothetical protein [Bacteriovoracaceae bacterium]